MSLEGFDPWLPELEDYFNGHGEPDEVWDGRASRNVRRWAMAEWLLTVADWKIFVTLTFKEDRPVDSAKMFFDRLVKALNVNLLGKHYRRVVGGKSYFSYALATEYQLRGVIHFHFLADRPLNFRLLHDNWNAWAGFAQTEVIANERAAVKYVVKYMVKSVDPHIYKSGWVGQPVVVPPWWNLLEGTDGGLEGGRALLGGPPA